MFDFFDEDFPLSKKQEDEMRKKLAKKADETVAEAATEVAEAVEDVVSETAEVVEQSIEVASDVEIDLSDVHIEEPEDYDDDSSTNATVSDVHEVLNEETVENIGGSVETVVENLTENVENAVEDVAEAAEETAEEAVTAVEETVAEAIETAEVTVEAAEETVEEVVEAVEEAPAVVEETADYIEKAADNLEEAAEEVIAETVDEYVSNDEIPEATEYAKMIAGIEDIAEDEPADDIGSYDEWNSYGEEPQNETAEGATKPVEIIMTEVAETVEDSEVKDAVEKIASIDEIEAHLHEELKSLGEKLDSMEKVVDGMEDGELPEGFDYEYDERYFAEEETPAYKRPDLYAKQPKTEKPKQHPIVPVKKQLQIPGNLKVDAKTVAKAGVAVAAAAIAVALFKKKK